MVVHTTLASSVPSGQAILSVAERYVIVDSYRNEEEKVHLMSWQLTGKCFFRPEEWEWILSRAATRRIAPRLSGRALRFEQMAPSQAESAVSDASSTEQTESVAGTSSGPPGLLGPPSPQASARDLRAATTARPDRYSEERRH
jgi:hypothetical protein